jgi:hypothetical protein
LPLNSRRMLSGVRAAHTNRTIKTESPLSAVEALRRNALARLLLRLRFVLLAVTFSIAPAIHAQLAPALAALELPDAPVVVSQPPPAELASADRPDQQSTQTPPQSTPPAPQSTAPASPGASGQTSGATIDTSVQGDERKELSEEQLKKQETQRVFGVIPAFNSVYQGAVPPLTPGQKMRLMFKSTTDIYVFGFSAITAGIGQAQNSHAAYGQGVEGYAKRYAATYADTADGNFWGNAVLPILWHEDPRYFRLGEGSFTHRLLYSMSTTVWCRRDDGSEGPNYANVVGNLISGGISNIYYPEQDRGVGQTFQNAATVTAEGMIGAALIEFWPDMLRHHQVKEQAKRDAAAAAARNALIANPTGKPPQ